MNKKWIPILLVVVLGIALFIVKGYRGETDTRPGTNNRRDPAGSSEPNRNRGFDRRVSFIEYTRHAQCRMECRRISRSEVEDIMRNGKINYRKSNVNEKPCPTYALEGTTADNQRVRIVFAQCDFKTKVVTCIDLGRDWACDCPGTERK